MSNDPGELSIEGFSYDLPDERIAKFPLEKRDGSKLLVYKDGAISETVFYQLEEYLQKNDLLVANQTRVIQARLVFRSSTDARIELFCLEPAVEGLDIQEAMLVESTLKYRCMVGNARKWKEGEILELRSDMDKSFVLYAKLVQKDGAEFIIEFSWRDEDLSFAEVLDEAGKIPLPPYLRREAEFSDEERYQTVYAKDDGSVAAPTAGLHFTDAVLKNLRKKGVNEGFLTLHVGAGTFKPVKSERMRDHDMHAEEIVAEAALIEQVSNCDCNLVAVGTTSLRSLESLYWTAVKLMRGESTSVSIDVDQWYPYAIPEQELPSRKQAFDFLYSEMKAKKLRFIKGNTRLIIAPGYKIRTADMLVTNFHQPKSTLLLLVSSCIGDDWKKVYEFALEKDFRFLSYGDSSLLYIQK